MKKLFKSVLCAAVLAAALDAFAEILPVTPAEGSIVPLLSANQKKLKEFSSPEERKSALEADLQEKKFFFGKTAVWRSQIPVVFAWKCTAGEPGPYRITISETPDFNDPIYLFSSKKCTISAPPAETKFKIGRKYYWKVTSFPPKSAKGKTVTESTAFSFQTEDLVPRWVSIKGPVGNIRDLGGYRTSDGRRVKQNIVFRGQGLNYNSVDKKIPGQNRLMIADLDYFLYENIAAGKTLQEIAGMLRKHIYQSLQ